jgi:hypothetical protein
MTARPVLCPSTVWHPNGTTVAGSSTGASGSTPDLLSTPYGLAVDSAFNVYVSDYGNYRIMKWAQGSTNGTKVGPQLGYGLGPDTQHMNSPVALALDSTESNLYISDTFNCRILKWNMASDNVTVFMGGNGCGSALNQFYWCNGLYVDR